MNALTRSTAVVALGVILSPFAASTALAQTATIHVDIVNGDPDPPNHGQNGWGTNAYRFLQDALGAAGDLLDEPEIEDVEIWVAAAFELHGGPVDPQLRPVPYRPDQRAIVGASAPCKPYGDCDRSHAFELRNDVRILGGFPDDPHLLHNGNGATLLDRDPAQYRTILSGDLERDDEFEINTIVVDQEVVSMGMTFDNHGDNCLRIVHAENVNNSAILDGFTVEGASDWNDCGLICFTTWSTAVYIKNATPTIRNSEIRRNYNTNPLHAEMGGGVYIKNSSLVIDPQLDQRVILSNCIIRHNSVLEGCGAMYVEDPWVADFINCRFEWNLTEEGGSFGAITVRGNDDAVSFVNCAISDNWVYPQGSSSGLQSGAAGMQIGHGEVVGPHVRLWNCLITGNRTPSAPVGGLTIAAPSEVEIINCTIAGNYSGALDATGGLYVAGANPGAQVTVHNSIIWENEPYETELPGGSSVLTIDHSNVEGGWTGGTGNIGGLPAHDPLFTSEYRLGALSPSIDAGETASLPCNEYWQELGVGGVSAPTACPDYPEELLPVDFDLNPRVAPCTVVDQGAFEHQSEPEEKCFDLNDNGVVDVEDLLLLLGEWGECTDVCDCPEDFNNDGEVDVADLLLLLANWGDSNCAEMTFSSDEVPESVEDCYDLYFAVDINRYESCLEWIAQQEEYLP